jgi:hypothetical protein
VLPQQHLNPTAMLLQVLLGKTAANNFKSTAVLSRQALQEEFFSFCLDNVQNGVKSYMIFFEEFRATVFLGRRSSWNVRQDALLR